MDTHFFTENKTETIEKVEKIIEENEKEVEIEPEDRKFKEVNKIIEEDTFDLAPELLHLTKNEKFKDNNGNIVEIETRGVRHYNKIYFKVNDVSIGFNMEYLDDVLYDKTGGYTRGIDYKTFLIDINLDNSRTPTFKKSLYLTYHGLLRVLFVSRNNDVKRFQDWAMEKLFTIQMGLKEEKIKLGTELLDISVRTFKAVFDKYASKFPCIYLISLGKVGELRDTFGIDPTKSDELDVYKFGFTDDLERRLTEHTSTFGKMKNVNIKLACFHTVDVKYTSEAEGEIRTLFKFSDLILTIEGFNELVAFDQIKYKHVIRQYKMIGEEYMGNTAGLQKEMDDLREQIKDLKHVIELKDKDLLFKDQQLSFKEKELSYKDREIELLNKCLIK